MRKNNTKSFYGELIGKSKSKSFSGIPTIPCKYFLAGRCDRGNACTFLHDKNESKRNFFKSNKTRSLIHDDGESSWKERNSKVAIDVLSFCKGLDSFKKNSFYPEQLELWKGAFEAAASNELKQYESALCKVYLQLTDNEIFAPKPNDVLKVITNIIQNSTSVNNNTISIAAQIIDTRLMRSTSMNSIQDKTSIFQDIASLMQACSKLMSNPAYSEAAMTVITMLVKYKETVINHPSRGSMMIRAEGSDAVEAVKGDPSFGWLCNSTIAWLSSDEWIGKAQLAKKYNSVEEYVATLRNVWATLTFYWGTAAFWPRCKCCHGSTTGDSNNRQAACGNPLLTRVLHPSAERCTMLIEERGGQRRSCNKEGAWKCFQQYSHRKSTDGVNRFHSSHDIICTNCLSKRKASVLKAIGTSDASTDIYDGTLTTVKFEQDVLLLNVKAVLSRKPPTVATNWRTSYRLQCSGLVGIISTSMIHGSLSPSNTIYWGEIVPFDNRPQNQEYEHARRNKKEVTIRILTKQDGLALPPMVEVPFKSGNTIAIIDLRVFVPEVISVLSTLFNDKFLDGIKRIPLQEAFTGDSSYFAKQANTIPILDKMLQLKLPAAKVLKEAIAYAIEESHLKCLQSLPKETRTIIATSISRIPLIQSLDQTQLLAFCYALHNHFHCTQGPPGTGKSYVGVCLVVALLIIRNQLKQLERATGPIITLSYKNHALDEFLVDILHANPSLNSGALIRVGKPEQPELQHYTERRSPEETEAQKELHDRLLTVHICKHMLKTWMNNLLYPTNAVEKVLCLFQGAVLYHLCAQTNTAGGDNQIKYIAHNVLARLKAAKHGGNESLFQYYDEVLEAEVFPTLYEEASYWDRLQFFEGYTTTKHKEDMGYLDITCFPEELTNAPRAIKLLLLWIEGYSLPPRCQVEHCSHSTAWGSSYCEDLHKCKYYDCTKLRDESKEYCRAHLCQAVGCVAGRVPHQLFCRNHICLLCFQKPRAISSLVEAVCGCDMHLCTVPGCYALRIAAELPFCVDHCCMLCKESGTITQVSLIHKTNAYCVNHTCAMTNCSCYRISNVVQFCHQHTCLYCDAPLNFAIPELLQSQVCLKHCCNFMDEDGEHCFERQLQLADGLYSPFCIEHTCPVCVHCGNMTPECADSNCGTCYYHPFCQFIDYKGFGCDGICTSANEAHCPYHTEYIKRELFLPKFNNQMNFSKSNCCGINSKGKPCGMRRPVSIPPNQRWYCHPHSNQEPPNKHEIEDDEDLSAIPVLKFSNIQIPELSVDELCAYRASRPYICVTDTVNNSTHNLLFVRTCNVSKCSNVATTRKRDCLVSYCKMHALQQQWAGEERKFREQILLVQRESREKQKEIRANEDTMIKESQSAKKQPKSLKSSSEKANAAENTTNYRLVQDEAIHYKESATAANVNPDEIEEDEEDFAINDDIAIRRELYQDEDVVDDEFDNAEDDMSDDFDVDDADFEEHDDILNITDLTTSSWKEFVDSFLVTLEEGKSFWGFSVVERDEIFQSCLKKVIIMLKKLLLKSEAYVDEARAAKASANASVFKRASVIGATIVGASRRLMALREAEPFAVIVEEACEVMEPTLVSVLAVESLEKLELIGDQRQLPAFIQQCWYNLECTMPSIKKSLFERMVDVSNNKTVESQYEHDGNLLPGDRSSSDYSLVKSTYCTVLDVQRRMRTSISNLTKPHYEDVVQIQDHEKTATQLLADRLDADAKKKYQIERIQKQVWVSKGRNIPGLQQNVFFWNMLQNEESRPEAGLSACNQNEATAVVMLVKYLQSLYVPLSCITIITPYAGQKRLLTKLLRNARCLPAYQKQFDRNAEVNKDILTVSTVDRYQGDENDIVILSLVRTKPGNRFVNLLNRFIVATSRARLGFYIIGSTEAVSSSFELHDTIPASLSTESANALSSEGMQSLVPSNATAISTHRDKKKSNHWDGLLSTLMEQHQVGSYLPVCCPQHSSDHTSTTFVSSAKTPVNSDQHIMYRHFPTAAEGWCQVCSIPCGVSMPCSHPCPLQCHVLNESEHLPTSQCQELVPRPCSAHKDIELYCREINVKRNQTLDTALSTSWKCNIEDTYQYPTCIHTFAASCADHEMFVKGSKSYPPCTSVIDEYITPSCGHVIKNVKCATNQKYMLQAPVCRKKVSLVRHLCGHIMDQIPCFEAVKERTKPSNCQENIIFERPRCTHLLSSPCHLKYAMIESWNANYQHVVTHKCTKEEMEIVSSNEKQEKVVHKEMMVVVEELPCDGHYGGSTANLAGGQVMPCQQLTVFRRFCGHDLKIPCDQAFAYANKEIPLPRCEAAVPLQLCNCCDKPTISSLHCYQLEELELWNPFQLAPFAMPKVETHIPVNEEESTHQVDIISIAEEQIPLDATTWITEMDKEKWKLLMNGVCNTPIVFHRNCGHTVKLKCIDVQRYFHTPTSIRPCKHKVSRVLTCGHTLTVPCHQRNSLPEPPCKCPPNHPFVFPKCRHTIQPTSCMHLQQLKAAGDSLQCKEIITDKLYRCGHRIQLPCYLQEKCGVSGHDNGEIAHRNNENATSEERVGEEKELVVYEEREYCIPCEELPHCQQLVTYKRQCGHEMKGTLCHDAFDWAYNMQHITSSMGMITTESTTKLPPPCDVPRDIPSYELCGHALTVPCHVYDTMQSWRPWSVVEHKHCNKWHHTSTQSANALPADDEMSQIVMCYPLNVFPNPLPYGCYEDIPACTVPMSVYFSDCEHVQSVHCHEIYDPLHTLTCQVPVMHTCTRPHCGKESVFPCSLYRPLSIEQRALLCHNVVTKLCSLCQINRMQVKCCDFLIECNQKVTKTLSCGHVISWVCGSVDSIPLLRDDDPANEILFDDADGAVIRRNKHCIQCAIECWNQERTICTHFEPTEQEPYALVAHERIQTLLGERNSIVSSKRIKFPIKGHQQAKGQLMSSFLNALNLMQMSSFKSTNSAALQKQTHQQQHQLVNLVFPLARTTIEESLLNQYEVVFLETDPTKTEDEIEKNVLNRFRAQPTQYGMGLKMKKFSKTNLQQLISLNGTVRVIIGLAYQINPLCSSDTSPFVPSPEMLLAIQQKQGVVPNRSTKSSKKQSKGKPAPQAKQWDKAEVEQLSQQVHQTRQAFITKGFDSVRLVDEAETEKETDGPDTIAKEVDYDHDDTESYIYWNTGIVLPIGVYTFQFHTACIICGEYAPKDCAQGALCTNDHFLCWGCFETYLTHATAADAIAAYLNTAGQLCCPECHQGYTILSLAAHLPKSKQSLLQALLSIQVQHQVHSQVQEERKSQEKSFQKELQRIRDLDTVTREIELLRHEITDSILTNKCPRCAQAFLDFDGCCSVRCGNKHCGTHFCGYCFVDCGLDAHAHAANCMKELGGKGIFCDVQTLEKIWNQTRIRKMKLKMANKSNVIKRKVFEGIQKQLQELYIPLTSFDDC